MSLFQIGACYKHVIVLIHFEVGLADVVINLIIGMIGIIIVNRYLILCMPLYLAALSRLYL